MSKFEDFLMEKHAEQFIGTKDAMIDDFEKWLCDLDLDALLNYGEMFGNLQREELLKVCKEIYSVLSGYRGEPWFPKDTMHNIERAVEKAERK
jgi:hypothetical protein